MGMMDLLYHTYEYAYQAKDTELMENFLMAQTSASAPILLWITQEGEFADASYISDKARQKISIPCTEKSAGRSGKNPVPHPLFDKLFYLAGDGEAVQLHNQKAHDMYMQNLQAWCESAWSNLYIKAIFRYLSKNTLLHDLQRLGVISLSQPKDLEKHLNEVVRIGIRRDFDTDLELWREPCIREDFHHYLNSAQGEKGFCYITGEMAVISENHPKSIWNTKANAKLISANEKANRGFVYSGRYTSANQAVQLSYEASQKIHNALKWLIQKQGFPVGDKLLIAWGTSGTNVQAVFDSSDAFFDFFGEEAGEDGENFNTETRDNGKNQKNAECTGIKNTADTQAEFSGRLKKAIFRQEQDLQHNEKIAFLVLEAATPGRLSVSYYQEFTPIQYVSLIQTIETWHREHAWKYSRYHKEKKTWDKKIKSPSVYEIARFAEGVERNGKLEVGKSEEAKKIEGNTILRLLPCVIDGKAVPKDIKMKLLHKACHPLNYSEANWNRLLKITCSMIRTEYQEVGTMDINRDSKDISYNYGRWLAVAHEIERRALWSADEKRETNALRLFTKYAEYPCKYMMIIKNKLRVYEKKLGEKANCLQMEGENISAKLMENPLEEVQSIRHLDGRMVLGFEAQMESFRNNGEKKDSRDKTMYEKKNDSEGMEENE